MMIMIKWLRRLICGECDCSERELQSKYAPERDIDTVEVRGWRGDMPKCDIPPPKPPHNPNL